MYQTNLELEFYQNKVFSFEVDENTLSNKQLILDGIPGAPWHDGGRIMFGPDQKLYISTGDAINPELSQDLSSLAGKILRINSDGTIPDDNPFNSSPVFSYGHRNPQGLAWSTDGLFVSSEHGPSGELGYGHDEINVILKGKNYGWPNVVGTSSDTSFVIVSFSATICITSFIIDLIDETSAFTLDISKLAFSIGLVSTTGTSCLGGADTGVIPQSSVRSKPLM